MIEIVDKRVSEASSPIKVAIDIAIMTSAHPPFDTRIFVKQACSLAKSGRRVMLICCHPKSEIVDGVYLHGIAKAEGRLGRMIVTTFRVLRVAIASKAPICHFHDPELIPAGFLLKLFGRKVIYDVHEDVPLQIRIKHWIHPWLRVPIAKMMAAIEWMAARAFDRIVPATPTIARRFPPHKTVTVQNFPIIGELAAEDAIPYRDRPATVAYVGVLTEGRGAVEMIEAIDLIGALPNLQLEFAGDLSPAGLKNELQERSGWSRVRSHGMLGRSSVRDMLARARMGLVLFHAEPNHVNAQPNKLFEYMSAGLPVIASDFPLWRKIVEGAGAGVLVDPTDTQAIADAISWILSHQDKAAEMGRRGREAVLTQYNWTQEEKKLLSLYDRLDAITGRTP